MRLQFKHQNFQAEAARAVVDVFAGQPCADPSSYMMDPGKEDEDGREGRSLFRHVVKGYGNRRISPTLTDEVILQNLHRVQQRCLLNPSESLEGHYNLTIEMETGVGKTYTYIKTMYELHKHYGWTKFIVVVPSIAIREGVYKSFQVTEEHFNDEYGEKIRFFVYNSSQLTEIDRFASDSAIHVMIINSQAFNAKGKDARRIYMKLDEFRSRRPIDIIAETNPIVIIDEPQSVEGKQTKENLKQFHPLMTLRYSATHKKDSLYNMVYRLDAVEAYNKHLVKKIKVVGISESGVSASGGYVYLESINLSKAAPTATLRFDCKGKSGVRQISRNVSLGYDLYGNSHELEEYKDNFIVTGIDGRDNSVSFGNGKKIFVGEVIGHAEEEEIRRIQIRETIRAHIERERALFSKGIKVLSLFFIDEVAKYKQYDAAGKAANGLYADMFEEEYEEVVRELTLSADEEPYKAYLAAISARKTHAGYFSIDKKGKMIDSKVKRKETASDDVDAYDLIMRDKERLLDRDPKRSPVRFIFSHSALREGWDNPNVFQICTLKQSSSEVRKRQEVGRGLRLCVNEAGERMDENALGKDVQQVNVLTVIASESYESFADGLQKEIAEAVADRPQKVENGLFMDKVLKDNEGREKLVDQEMAENLMEELIIGGYVRKGRLTEKYHAEKASGKLELSEDMAPYSAAVIQILDSIYDAKSMRVANAKSDNVELHVQRERYDMPEFQELWKRIHTKSTYVVDFDTKELVERVISTLDQKLHVSKLYVKIESGTLENIRSKAELLAGKSFKEESAMETYGDAAARSQVKYDLIGKLVEETKLTRKDVVRILKGIKPSTFAQFRDNPEEFILKAAMLIKGEMGTVIIEHIKYNVSDETYDSKIFTDSTIKGRLGTNAMKVKKHLYDHLVYDSENEKDFAAELDKHTNVAVYVKLPNRFYIPTPLGHYNPDWAIAFYEGDIKHIYFVAETKGSMDPSQLRPVEKFKIHCAKEHFKAISQGDVVYDVVDSYDSLLNLVTK